MALPILIMGKSGSGKTASLRNVSDKCFVINVNNKPLPFRTKENIIQYSTDEYLKVREVLSRLPQDIKNVVIDDAGYLLTAKFMNGHRGGKGNAQFELYNEIADSFYSLIKYIQNTMPQDINVYVIMHEDKNDFGEVKPKTIGKLLDDKVCVEGMFTIVLHALKLDGKYLFATRTDGLDVTKTPIGMFEDEYVDNDLELVNNTINKYYKGEN